jgi:hypothetical protein
MKQNLYLEEYVITQFFALHIMAVGRILQEVTLLDKP